MEPFKNLISPDLVALIAKHIARQFPAFDADGFCAATIPALDALEMKARVGMLADHLHGALPSAPSERNQILAAILHPDRLGQGQRTTDEQGVAGWGIWPLTTLVGRYGLDDFDGSLALLRLMTMRHTAEFDVRPYLIADQTRALKAITAWAQDENHHVRRLASEGTRPRLPWGVKLPALCADPTPVLPVLAVLRDDPSDYVRRSVANHLNDISKDHPDLLITLATEWAKGADKNRMAMLRHACRTMIKDGHPEALAIFGFGPARVDIAPISLSSPDIAMGDSLEFNTTITSSAEQAQNLSIDYVIHFRKANGRTAPKVFKGGKAVLAPGATMTFARRHAIRPITTRTYYAGAHSIALRVNGVDTEAVPFTLTV
ncbi:MAG: DNA alkylation repair protein [Pikeienuella sp.]